MIVKEPTPALQQEPEETKLFPKVSSNDVEWMSCDEKVLNSWNAIKGTSSPFK